MMKMASSGLPSFETGSVKDDNVERLFKTFTLKCLQVIVQSRVDGRSAKNQSSSSECFCVSIPDNPFVEDRIRKSLEGIKSFPVTDQNICLEVSLVTSDGDRMFLEAWEISFSHRTLDVSANKIQHIFPRMGVTLKSLLCATRALPAHRLARSQGETDGGYRLQYHLYLGHIQTNLLGEGFKMAHAGSVPTAFGLLSINAAFRTKLLLSSDMSTSVIEVTDNYFVNEFRASGSASEPKPCTPLSQRPESPYCFAVSPSPKEKDNAEILGGITPNSSPLLQNSIFTIEDFPEPVVGPFSAPKASGVVRKVEQEMLFEGLMKKSLLARQLSLAQTRDRAGESNVDGEPWDWNIAEKEQDLSKDENENRLSSPVDVFIEDNSLEEEYVMIDKPPFAADDDPRDAKSFLSSMYRAANLYDLSDAKISVVDYLSDVEALVFKLEEDMPELDEFCQSVISAHSRDEDESPQFS